MVKTSLLVTGSRLTSDVMMEAAMKRSGTDLSVGTDSSNPMQLLSGSTESSLRVVNMSIPSV